MSRKFKHLSVLALKRRGEGQAVDEGILGDGEFVRSVLSEMDELQKENLRVGPVPRSLFPLAEQMCEVHPVTLSELRSGSRRHEVAAARQG